MALPKYSQRTLQSRVRLANTLANQDVQVVQLRSATDFAGKPRVHDIPFPDGLAPIPQPMDPPPGPLDPLPKADMIVMVDTVAEAAAMADVLTPGTGSKQWYHYARRFKEHYLPMIGRRGPSRTSKRLGSYFLTKVNGVQVLCYKTELHLSPDAKKLPDGSYTLPIKDMLQQIIEEVQPQVFLTTGTSGGVYTSMHLGDVVVTRAARFACQAHFGSAPFNNHTYKSEWTIPTKYRAAVLPLMQAYAGQLEDTAPNAVASRGAVQAALREIEPADKAMRDAVEAAVETKTPPSHDCVSAPPGYPTLMFFDGEGDIPPFHPILTTDFFEFGTSTNHLSDLGVAVEMDDAVLGLVCSTQSDPPKWASVRNLSDPTINGELDQHTQIQCAEYYYARYGYWTSVMSALTAWSMVAGVGG